MICFIIFHLTLALPFEFSRFYKNVVPLEVGAHKPLAPLITPVHTPSFLAPQIIQPGTRTLGNNPANPVAALPLSPAH